MVFSLSSRRCREPLEWEEHQLTQAANLELAAAPFVTTPTEKIDSAAVTTPVTRIPTYEFADGTIVSFRKAKHVQGMSHRVSINGLAVDYLQENMRPSAASARFFFAKYANAL